MSGTGHRTPGRGWMDRLAHDLRGPLSPLQTAVFLLRDGRVDPSRRGELLDMIDRQHRRLGAMIDEISDWVCAEQGRLIVDREDTGLAILLERIDLSAHSAAPAIHFGPGTEGLHLPGDRARLGQLLRTLATVRLARADSQPVRLDIDLATPTRVRVLRHLACAGDAVEQAEKLLDHALPDPHDDGLGLGLLLARAIAQAHGGSLHMRAIDPDTIALEVELPAGDAMATGATG